jgi:AcrR family transcriptional regulator
MPDDPRRRSDAERNREAILAAALTALTESADVSLNAIAKRANVANATLYRHFPTREQLVLEVYGEEVRHLVLAADELLEERTPSEALAQWVARLAQYAMTKHGLASALQAATSQPAESFPDTYQPIVGALAKLIAAAEAAGSVKPGLRADDVILLFAGLFQMDPGTDWKAQSARLYGLALEGLRADANSD